MKKILAVAAFALAQHAANAQTPDWATKVAPILYNHCTSCHHDGGIAPFSLISYDTAVAYASSIRSQVLAKTMPPWPPDPTYSHLAHERVLSAADISTIVNWVNGGKPSGTLSLAPPAPVYANHGSIPGTPDLVVKIPTYTSTAASGDVYQCFVIPSTLVADKYIRAFEAIPGNPACVHHVLVFSDTTGKCASLQAASLTPPGYPDFGGVGTDSATMLGVWVPGSDPMMYPSGFGLKIPANADIVLQVHYPAGTAGLVDSTEVHFFFAPTTGTREVFMQPVLYHFADMTDGPLVIPANTVKTFHEKFPGPGSPFPILPFDMSVLGVFPHMHLLGKSIESYAVHLAGDTDKLIRINDWDFHWQGFYMLPKIRKVPLGSVLYAEATYDNTSANPENPHSPPQTVVAGENTTDEMMIVFFVFTTYQPGDENIIADSTLLKVPWQQANYYRGQQLLGVTPNPAGNDIVVKCHFDEADKGSLELVDMQGKVVRTFMKDTKISEGYNAFSYSVNGLPAGTYSLRLKTSERILSQKVVVVH